MKRALRLIAGIRGDDRQGGRLRLHAVPRQAQPQLRKEAKRRHAHRAAKHADQRGARSPADVGELIERPIAQRVRKHRRHCPPRLRQRQQRQYAWCSRLGCEEAPDDDDHQGAREIDGDGAGAQPIGLQLGGHRRHKGVGALRILSLATLDDDKRRQRRQDHIVLHLLETHPTADQLRVGMARLGTIGQVGADSHAAVQATLDAHATWRAAGNSLQDMRSTMRKHGDVSGLQNMANPVDIKHAAAARDDVERHPTAFLAIVIDGPLRTEPADKLQLRPNAQERCKSVEHVFHIGHACSPRPARDVIRAIKKLRLAGIEPRRRLAYLHGHGNNSNG